MNYCQILDADIANGPGMRVSLFVSGCRLHCDGCFNQEAWDFNYGKPFDEAALEKILKMLEPDYIDGLTILGGEPLDIDNLKAVSDIVRQVRYVYEDRKTIWLYTGYYYKTLTDVFMEDDYRRDPLNHILSEVNMVVAGPFLRELAQAGLRYRGSTNQSFHVGGRGTLLDYDRIHRSEKLEERMGD